MDVVPVNGRYVFLLDISASMDELPLAKMVFTRLAASLVPGRQHFHRLLQFLFQGRAAGLRRTTRRW